MFLHLEGYVGIWVYGYKCPVFHCTVVSILLQTHYAKPYFSEKGSNTGKRGRKEWKKTELVLGSI